MSNTPYIDEYRNFASLIADMTDGTNPHAGSGSQHSVMVWNRLGSSPQKLGALAAEIWTQTADIGLIIRSFGALQALIGAVAAVPQQATAETDAALNTPARALFQLLGEVVVVPTPEPTAPVVEPAKQ